MGGLCCAPLNYALVENSTQSAANRRMIEEGRTLANLVSTPQERLDEERAVNRLRTQEAQRDLEVSLQGLRLIIYTTNERVIQLDRLLIDAIQEREAIWQEKVVKPAASAPFQRPTKSGSKRAQLPAPPPPPQASSVNALGATIEGLPAGINANDYARYQSAVRRCEDLSSQLALLQCRRDFFATYSDTLMTGQVLQQGAAVMQEVGIKFNEQDARELHEKFDRYTNQLHEITQEFAKLHQTSTIHMGDSTPPLTLSPTFRADDMQRLKRDLLPRPGRSITDAPHRASLGPPPSSPLYLAPPPSPVPQALPMRPTTAAAANRRFPPPPPPPPSAPEAFLPATALDDQ